MGVVVGMGVSGWVPVFRQERSFRLRLRCFRAGSVGATYACYRQVVPSLGGAPGQAGFRLAGCFIPRAAAETRDEPLVVPVRHGRPTPGVLLAHRYYREFRTALQEVSGAWHTGHWIDYLWYGFTLRR